jgi:L-alanine-DL-glutamate epimerase-like enolase superfamily enzyme
LHPRNVFRISRAERRETTNVFLRIERDGIAGMGEASANAYYGEDAARVAAKLDGMAGFLAGCPVNSPADIAAIWEEAWALLTPSRAAQCALDVALWDWLAKRRDCTVAELALGEQPRPVGSFVTLGISEPRELDAKLAELEGFPSVKVKSDGSGDLSLAARVRDAMPGASIAVDANCAWEDVEWTRISRDLAQLWIEFVEQPFPPARDGDMGWLHSRIPVPTMADESCVTLEDIERMPGHFTGFNIKLVKCGGLTPALRMARRGRERGLRTMVGCMLESSILIAAGAVVAQITDYADLDGAWLLADDPASGWKLEQGTLIPGEGMGLGVSCIADDAV